MANDPLPWAAVVRCCPLFSYGFLKVSSLSSRKRLSAAGRRGAVLAFVFLWFSAGFLIIQWQKTLCHRAPVAGARRCFPMVFLWFSKGFLITPVAMARLGAPAADARPCFPRVL